MVGQPLPDRVQPWTAVVVIEWRARGHLRDVGRRVKRVGIGKRNAEPTRQRRAHGRLARSGDAHHHDRSGWWMELFSAHATALADYGSTPTSPRRFVRRPWSRWPI